MGEREARREEEMGYFLAEGLIMKTKVELRGLKVAMLGFKLRKGLDYAHLGDLTATMAFRLWVWTWSFGGQLAKRSDAKK